MALVGLAAGGALLAGCVQDKPAEASPVDLERAEQLRADPWLRPEQVGAARPVVGSGDRFDPGYATAVHELSAPPFDAVRAELAAAGEAGWTPYYARCPVEDGSPLLDDVDMSEPQDAVVLLARELTDGALAEAEIRFGGWTDETSALRARVSAEVPSHAHPSVPRPADVDVATLACLSSDGTGPEVLGEPVRLARAD